MSSDKYKDVEFDFYASTDPEQTVIMATICLEIWLRATVEKGSAYRAEKYHRVVELCQSHGPGDMSTMVNLFDSTNMIALHKMMKLSGQVDLLDWLDRFFMTQHPDLADMLSIKPKEVA